MQHQQQENLVKLLLQGEGPKGFEWIDVLSQYHQQLFTKGIEEALAQPVSTSDMEELLESWEATAELDAAPEVAKFLKRNPDQRAN